MQRHLAAFAGAQMQERLGQWGVGTSGGVAAGSFHSQGPGKDCSPCQAAVRLPRGGEARAPGAHVQAMGDGQAVDAGRPGGWVDKRGQTVQEPSSKGNQTTQLKWTGSYRQIYQDDAGAKGALNRPIARGLTQRSKLSHQREAVDLRLHRGTLPSIQRRTNSNLSQNFPQT